MIVTTAHPRYSSISPDWTKMRDIIAGERQIKIKSETYLPATASMKLDGMGATGKGLEDYSAYKVRAVFPNHTKEAVENYMGMLHHKCPIITLPPQLEPLREVATVYGESLEELLRRINQEQMITGRVGLHLDVKDNMPYILTYSAESMYNWDDGTNLLEKKKLNFLALDESAYIRDGFSWVIRNRYRVLTLVDGLYFNEIHNNEGIETELFPPSVRGKTLDFIPFVVINTKDLLLEPDEPPLLGLGNSVLAIYRAEADYRTALYMQGQDTLVVVGGNYDKESALRVGAGTRVDVDLGGDAKYIGVASKGLPEMRLSLENDYTKASLRAGIITDNRTQNLESGQALQIRLGAQTATLNQIALTGAAGLEEILEHAATWVGADPELVSVTPNLDFINYKVTGQDLLYMMQAKQLGAPLSLDSIHTLLAQQGMTPKDFTEEMSLVDSEPKVSVPNVRSNTGQS